MLTVQELRPTVRHMDDLTKSGVSIGYQKGSFTLERLKQMGFDESRLKIYNSPQEMRALFLNKSSNGGIDAAFDEVAYIKLFMAKYCSQYSIIEPSFKADGFGFAFPLGSPLVSDISRQILNITEGETMKAMENKWFIGENHCLHSTISDSLNQLDHHSFKALFLIVFGVSLFLVLFMLAYKRYKETHGNVIEPPINPPNDGPEGQSDARDGENRNVNVAGEEVNEDGNLGGRGEADNNEHHIVEVNGEGNGGGGDGDETNDNDDNIMEMEPALLQLQDPHSPPGLIRRRGKKIISRTDLPLRKVEPPARMNSA